MIIIKNKKALKIKGSLVFESST